MSTDSEILPRAERLLARISELGGQHQTQDSELEEHKISDASPKAVNYFRELERSGLPLRDALYARFAMERPDQSGRIPAVGPDQICEVYARRVERDLLDRKRLARERVGASRESYRAANQALADHQLLIENQADQIRNAVNELKGPVTGPNPASAAGERTSDPTGRLLEMIQPVEAGIPVYKKLKESAEEARAEFLKRQARWQCLAVLENNRRSAIYERLQADQADLRASARQARNNEEILAGQRELADRVLWRENAIAKEVDLPFLQLAINGDISAADFDSGLSAAAVRKFFDLAGATDPDSEPLWRERFKQFVLASRDPRRPGAPSAFELPAELPDLRLYLGELDEVEKALKVENARSAKLMPKTELLRGRELDRSSSQPTIRS